MGLIPNCTRNHVITYTKNARATPRLVSLRGQFQNSRRASPPFVIFESPPPSGCVGSLTSPANQYREDAGDGAYCLSSLSEKTRTSNHLQMSLQRQHILLSYFKTLSVGPVWGSNPRARTRDLPLYQLS